MRRPPLKAPLARTRRVRRLADAKRRGDPGFADFELADSPFYLIARTAGRYAIDMDEALRAIDMDVPSWRALMIVHHTNPSSVSEIADQAVVKLSTMTRVVQRLEKRGLVRLSRRESDARVTEVYITDRGEDAVVQVKSVASRIYRMAFSDFTAREVAAFNDMLRRVFGNLS
ncbi:MAG TPA: MarR family transcriptional regulator [Steroidobacteraceae bacterium]|nr:MarR family transcriptional regulator [Steroidobacteraceae bacterium]